MKGGFAQYFLYGLVALVFTHGAYSQIKVDGQLLQRAELSVGSGTPALRTSKPAFSIGQRSRINVSYAEDNLRFVISAQDIRTWGNTAQLKASDGFFSLHQAYVDWSMYNRFSMRVGRQELNYDDARFLGNVDWVLQARAHDVLLLKYEDSLSSLHVGAAYNQDKQSLAGNFYTIAGQYKAAQFVRWAHQRNNLSLSLLFWNNGTQQLKYSLDSTRREFSVYMQTWGIPKLEYRLKNFVATAFYYQQTGYDVNNRAVNAFDVNIDLSYLISRPEKNGKGIRFTTGSEVLSGNSQFATSKTNYAFNPLYGTNHRFNGYMDYFYVGGRHINSVGLFDSYLKCKVDIGKSVFASINAHTFSAAADIRKPGTQEKASRRLGEELDITGGIIAGKSISFQVGYSVFRRSESMEFLRVANTREYNHWAYLMLLIRPGMKDRFTGMKY